MPRLIELDGLEVSLVPWGAVGKKFFLTKEGDVLMDPKELQTLFETELENSDKIEEVLKAGKMPDKAHAAIKGALKLLSAVKGDLPEDMRKSMLPKLAAQVGYGYPEPKTKEDANYKIPTVKEGGELDFDGVAPEVKDGVTALWKIAREREAAVVKERDAVKKELDDTKSKLDAEVDDRRTKEFIAKAAEFDKLPIKAEEYGPVLKKLHDTDKELYEKQLDILKAANEGNAKLFEEAGAAGEGTLETEPEKKLKAKADAIMKEDKSGMTPEQAYDQAMRENPELYQEHLAKQ